jgi:3-hydroxy-9,10-secoandrosta-1,3,5(10)-triene-9,17-dione monooxygenase reductase component
MSSQPPRSGSYGRISTSSGARSTGAADVLTGEPTDAAMRAARRRWASGVAVLTTFEVLGEELRLRGATVSSFTVVSLSPPLVLACLERETATARMVASSGVFAVSILDLAHEALADRFAGYGPMPDARFTGISYQSAATGAPVLTGASAWFDCQVQATHDGGDHVIVVGEVVAIGLGEETDDPLVSYDGAYRRIEGA